MFKKGFYSHIGANQPIVAGTINLGSTKGRGSSTRMFNYCNQRSANPSECINQFITINPTNNCLINNWKRVNFINNDNTLYFERIGMSYDGKLQTLVVFDGNIYISQDYGNTWNASNQNFNVQWLCISMSNNGQYQTAIARNEYIYTSNNYGLTWVQNLTTSNNNIWSSVCVSETGQYQTAVVNGYDNHVNNGFIYQSSNYGVIWNVTFPYNNCWTYVAMSNNGQYQTAVSLLIDNTSDPNNVLGHVFNSDDYGNTWTKNNSLQQSYYTCVGINGSGQIQIVGVNNCNPAPAIPGPLFISNDYGKTFTQTVCPYDAWLNISINNIGNIILACSYQQKDNNNNIVPDTGKMMVSYDYGNTWEQTNAGLNTWTSAIISKNACVASASAWGSGVYVTN